MCSYKTHFFNFFNRNNPFQNFLINFQIHVSLASSNYIRFYKLFKTFEATYKNILKNSLSEIYKENMTKENVEEGVDTPNKSIRILMKDKKVYDFCKKDIKRICFILEKLIKDKKISYQIL